MTIPRSRQICLELTPYYHCTTKCVRGAFLFGRNKETGKSYNHRRSWTENWLLKLSQIFCIDLVGYSVMTNHYHVILRVDTAGSEKLSDRQIASRWSKLYKSNSILEDYVNDREIAQSDRTLIESKLRFWRSELTNISRFMGYINERVARQSNREDKCTGRFWQGRFHLQALLDEKALLNALVYVDLNPVRAGVDKHPESSRFTSLRQRLDNRNSPLFPFRKNKHRTKTRDSEEIPISFENYLKLIDWSGRRIAQGKKGKISKEADAILYRLGFSQEEWLKDVLTRTNGRPRALGKKENLAAYCAAIGQKWICQTT